MHTRRERELNRIKTADRTVDDAEATAALAHARAKGLGGDAGTAAADFEDMQLRIARERQAEAHEAHARGDRRRQGFARTLAAFGLGTRSASPPPPPDAGARRAATSGTSPQRHVGSATRAYIRGLGPHDAEEDLHPHRLDAAESELEDALGREDLARRAAERDARDAL